MKKILSTAAALGLLAGMATTASALEFKVSGHYTLEGIYLDKGDGNGVELNDPNATADAWYQHTFEIKPTMKVNDKVSMFATIRLADNTKWGNQSQEGDIYSGIDGDGRISTVEGDVYVHHLYMDYTSPIGKVRVGRVPAGGYGLDFADTEVRANRIMLWPTFLPKPFSALVYLQKNTERDGRNTTSATDTDHYEARLGYKTDALEAGVRYGYTNDNSTIDSEAPQSITGYGKYKMNNLFVNGELTHNFGKQSSTVDRDSWGAMVQVGGKFNALTPSLMYFHTSGDNDADTDNEVFGSTGTEFTPLYILTGRNTGLLNNDQASGYTTTMTNAGVHALVLAADYAASDRLTLHGAIGWAQADKEAATWDDEYGFEYNIGAAYKLLDNLTYEARAGYLDTGDFFKGANKAGNTEDVFVLTHSLTMTF